MGALAVVVGAPALAHAQQGGLFPLAPIRRERVPCAAEDPVYKMYRQEYFGYHPTCWRRFPTGWGCPSPEAPNAEKAFKELPRDKPPAELQPNGEESLPDTGPGGPAPGGRAGGARSAPAGPGGPDTKQPGAMPPLPPEGANPFDIPKAGAPAPVTPPGPSARAPERAPSSRSGLASAAAAPGGNAPPDLPASEVTRPPALNPPASAPRTEAAPPAAAADMPAAQPLLALPDPTVGPSSSASSNAQPLPDLASPGGNDATSAAAPAPAPAPRTSLLGRIFGGGSLFRR